MSGKFDFSKIKGFDNGKEMSLGVGLLNDSSKEQAIEKMEIVYLKINQIIPNPKNKMSIKAIPELAQQIEMAGLVQPLEVMKMPDDSYMLLTGHRRLEAIKLLDSQGKWKGEYVPCTIRDLDKMDIPLDRDSKEMFAILTTNQHRTKTEADILFEYREWNKLYIKLRKAGVENFLLGKDEKGQDIVQQIKGTTTRDLIAEALETSPAQVAKIKKVDDKGSKKLLKAIKDDHISISNAEKVASLSQEEQDALIDHMLERDIDKPIKARDIEVYQKNKRKNKKEDKIEDTVQIEWTDIKKNLKEVQDILKEGAVALNASEYKTYSNCINKITRIIKNAPKGI